MITLKKFFKKNMKVLTALGLVITLVLSSTVAIAFADSSTPTGSGTSADPYIITTASQLARIPTLGSSKYYELGNDIDLSGYGQWVPVAFSGTFDGNKHSISGLTIGTSSSPYTSNIVGLFGDVENATIENLTTLSANVYANGSTNNDIAALAGYVKNSTISNCNVEGSVQGAECVGLLVGQFYSGTISNCSTSGTVSTTNKYGCGGLIGSVYGVSASATLISDTSSATVSGCGYLGGLVGVVNSSTKSLFSANNCSASGNVNGITIGTNYGDDCGGLIGQGAGSIVNCYASGNISGRYTLGGLVGFSYDKLINDYATGSVSGTMMVGGLAGEVSNNYGVGVNNCFSAGSVTGSSSIGGFAGELFTNANNCYESGLVTLSGSSNSSYGAFAGNYNLGSTTYTANDCYYDSSVNTIVKTDSQAISETSTAMRAQSFADMLNSNITSLSLTGTVAWKYSASVNAGYPYLDGIGVGVDTTPPTGTFSLSPSDSTPGPVTITLTATDDMSGVASITLPDGSTVTTATATYQVSANGDYDFTVKDNAGNSAVLTETVSNISATSTTSNLSIAATYALSSDSTNATVTADVTDDSGTTISVMDYASGTQTADYFASAGTAVTPSAGSGSGVIGVGTFTVSDNGTYTIYVKDSNGNEAVQTVTVSGIGSDSSSSSSDPGSSSSDPGSSSSDPDSSSSSETDTVGVSGTISASGISVTHPTTINYTIDANGNFLSPDFPITNNSAGPVKVTVQSLKSIAGGSLQFTDVDPLSEDWSNLDLADSLKYIALGIGADTSTGWTSGESTNTFWSVNTTPMAIGDIASAGSASLKLTAYNGKVFDKSYTAEHSLVLEFDLD